MKNTRRSIKNLGQLVALSLCLVWGQSSVASLDVWGSGARVEWGFCTDFVCDSLDQVALSRVIDGFQNGNVTLGGWNLNFRSYVRSSNEITYPGLNTSRYIGQAGGLPGNRTTTAGWGIDGYTYQGTDPITLVVSAVLLNTIDTSSPWPHSYSSGQLAVISPDQLNGGTSTDLTESIGTDISPTDLSSVSFFETGSRTLSVSIDLVTGSEFYLWSLFELRVGNGAFMHGNMSISFSHTEDIFSISEGITPIPAPIPASLWLFISGVVGFRVFSRR